MSSCWDMANENFLKKSQREILLNFKYLLSKKEEILSLKFTPGFLASPKNNDAWNKCMFSLS